MIHKNTRPVLQVIALLLCTAFISACSRQTLYENAMEWERFSAGLEQSSVRVSDLNIAYLSNIEPVDGETIVMVHGFGASKDNWTRLAAELTDEYNVYAVDLPGHGDSSKPLDLGYRFEDQVSYLAKILKALSIEKTHIMGNSMGGAITGLYAATYPDQIRSAVLFDPAGILEYQSELVDLVTAGDNPLIPTREGDFRRLINFVMEKEPFVPWPIYDVMEDKAIANREINEVIFAALRDSRSEPDFRKAITRIEAPVLVVWGKEDRVINYRNAEVFVDQIPDARKVLLEGVGHVPMVEVPQESAQLVREFLAETR